MKKITIAVSLLLLASPLFAAAQTSMYGGARNMAAVSATLQDIQQKVNLLRAQASATSTTMNPSSPQGSLQSAIDALQNGVNQANQAVGITNATKSISNAMNGAASTTPGAAGMQNALNRLGCIQLSSSLRLGLRGGDVTALQTFLTSLPSIYPEGLVTGTFGPLTEKAVQRFQASQGFEQTGTVGPLTRAAIHSATCGSTTP